MTTANSQQERGQTPPRTSTLLVTAIGLTTVGLLFRETAGLWTPAALGVAGILSLAACFELAARSGASTRRGVLLGLLTIPVGIGFIGGILGTSLVLVGNQFPVPSSPMISVAILRILGGLSIVVGCTVLLFGLVLGRRNTLSESSLRTYTKTAFITATPPLVLGLVLFIRVALGGRPGATQSLFGQGLSQAIQVVVAPAPPPLHLGSFLFVLTVAGASVVLFLRQTPTVDLLASRGGTVTPESLSRVQHVLQLVVSATALLFVPAIILETVVSPTQLRTALGPGLMGAIQAVTTAGFLRVLLFGVTVLTLGWVTIDAVLRQVLQNESDRQQWIGPFVAGGLLTVTAAVTATRVFNIVFTQATSRLPPSLGGEVQRRVLPVISVYGETAVIVLFAGVFVALAGLIGVNIWFAVSFGYLTDEGAGFSLASGGLILAAVGAVIGGAPTVLVLGAIVSSLVVWDIGTFGAKLGREVGTGETRSLELLHASATLFIGGCAVVISYGLLTLAPASADPSPTTTLALACLGIGIVALSLAIRG